MIRNFKELEQKVRGGKPRRAVLAMAQEADALAAILRAAAEGIVEPVLAGDRREIEKIAAKEGLSLDSAKVLHVEGGESLCASRAVEAVKAGEAELLMKGKVSTASLMKAVLNKEAGLRGEGLLSHVTLMEIPLYPKLLFMSDAGLNVAPDLETKVSIINNAAAAARKLGIQKPKVAILAAVEKVNPESMPATVEGALLSKMAQRGQIKDCFVDGPMALDNAVSRKSCEVKGIVSEVGGDADVLIVPDIEAGNIFYKAIAYLTEYNLAGMILGASVPIVLTSRSDSDRAKYLSILSAVALA